MRLVFLGSGDAFGSGGRFQTCMLVETRRASLLIDCGASSLVAMKRAGVHPNDIETILVSHLHGDHFGGLPFVVLDAQFVSKRTAPLTVAGPPGLADRLSAAMEVFFPGSSTATRKFELRVVELQAGERTALSGVVVVPRLAQHECGAPPFALRIELEGRVIAYSGDTEWTEELVETAADADLFVCEAFSFDRPTRLHLDLATLERKLPEIRAKRIVLTHLGPEVLARLSEVRHTTAADGMVIEID